MKGVDKVSRENGTNVVNISFPETYGGVWKVDSAFCSMSSITKLTTTTDTGDPMAVPVGHPGHLPSF